MVPPLVLVLEAMAVLVAETQLTAHQITVLLELVWPVKAIMVVLETTRLLVVVVAQALLD
jgi:hypothetical protein